MGWGRRLAGSAVGWLLTVLVAVVWTMSGSSAAGSQAPAGKAYVRPVPGVVLTAYRPPATRYGAGHRGVDLAAQPGAQVIAAGDGRVVFAGSLAGRGVVSIEHEGGLRTTYEPVTASVAKGATVDAGQLIGTVESGHASCAPASCLHWGARLGEEYLDPLLLLTPLRVRLKPWSE